MFWFRVQFVAVVWTIRSFPCHGPPPADKGTPGVVQQVCSDLTADRRATVAVVQRHCEVGAGVAVCPLIHQSIHQCAQKCAFLLQGVFRVSCNLLGIWGEWGQANKGRDIYCWQPADCYIPFLLSNLSAPLHEMTNEITAISRILKM
jgi:hypothetical protein